MNEVAKRNTLFTSIPCEQSVYFKQYSLWNGSLFGNCTVSAQPTVIAVNCRWKQDIQGKDINKTRKLIFYMNKVAKRNTLFTSIHCEEVVYSKQYCLWNWSLFGNGPVSAQNTVIAVNCRWEQDIQSKKTLIITATYFTHERSCKKKYFVYKHSLWRGRLF